jgi:hypothetical protein
LAQAFVLTALLALSAVVFTGCGTASTPQTKGASEASPEPANPGEDGISPYKWDDPMGGVRVTTALDPVQSKLPFDIHVPSHLGSPRGIYLAKTEPYDPPEFKQIEFVYDSPRFGRVVVLEHHPGLPSAEEYTRYMEWMASSNGTPEMNGTAQIVRLPNGQNALFEQGPDGKTASINWYVSSPRGDHEIMILAPDLTLPEAVEIASGFSN